MLKEYKTQDFLIGPNTEQSRPLKGKDKKWIWYEWFLIRVMQV